LKIKTLIKLAKDYSRKNNENFEDLCIILLTETKCNQLTKRNVHFDEDTIILTDITSEGSKND